MDALQLMPTAFMKRSYTVLQAKLAIRNEENHNSHRKDRISHLFAEAANNNTIKQMHVITSFC